MRLISRGRLKAPWIALFALAMAFAACQPAQVETSPTTSGGPQPPTVGPGLPIGNLHLTLKAPLPAEPVSIRYIGPDGAANGSTDSLPDDHSLTLARTFVVGVHGLLANEVECGTFDIEHNRETDVELTMSATGCTITTVQVHGDEVIHPDPADSTGTITGTGPAHSKITMVPLNVAEAPQVAQADESGLFSFDGLLPGRYRVGLAGNPGSAREVLVAAGETAVVELLQATTPP